MGDMSRSFRSVRGILRAPSNQQFWDFLALDGQFLIKFPPVWSTPLNSIFVGILGELPAKNTRIMISNHEGLSTFVVNKLSGDNAVYTPCLMVNIPEYPKVAGSYLMFDASVPRIYAERSPSVDASIPVLVISPSRVTCVSGCCALGAEPPESTSGHLPSDAIWQNLMDL